MLHSAALEHRRPLCDRVRSLHRVRGMNGSVSRLRFFEETNTSGLQLMAKSSRAFEEYLAQRRSTAQFLNQKGGRRWSVDAARWVVLLVKQGVLGFCRSRILHPCRALSVQVHFCVFRMCGQAWSLKQLEQLHSGCTLPAPRWSGSQDGLFCDATTIGDERVGAMHAQTCLGPSSKLGHQQKHPSFSAWTIDPSFVNESGALSPCETGAVSGSMSGWWSNVVTGQEQYHAVPAALGFPDLKSTCHSWRSGYGFKEQRPANTHGLVYLSLRPLISEPPAGH